MGLCAFYIVLVAICFGVVQSACNGGVYQTGVSDNERNQIVKLHNDIRLRIARGQVPNQPRGSNLKKLKWDKNLANAAQNIANSCEFAHKKVTDGRWRWVGQNLYTSWSTNYASGSDWNAAVNSWIDEHKKYKYGAPFSKDTGHYTQVIWANTEYVGCGYTYFATNGKYKYQKLYVCNYGPGGNIGGQKPYITGSSGCENLC